MEVILNSEIARLVLGYLKDQNLEKAHRKFCQTSKYLKDEYTILCRGYQPVSASNSNLIEIIKEYCEIKSQINQFINLFPSEILGNIQSQPNLTKRLEFILSKAKCEILREVDSSFNERNGTKRKRSISVTSSTSDTECTDRDSSFVKPAPCYRKSKIFKSNSPIIDFTLLRSKDKNKILKSRYSNESTYDDSENHAITSSADLTVMKETLLENKEFQNKLAENINKIMNSSANDNDKKGDEQPGDKGNGNSNQIQFAINTAIDNIISTIEQDPIFDHIIQDVVSHQSILYGEELDIINGGKVECNTNQENPSRESPGAGISRTSTPKDERELNNSNAVYSAVALNAVNDAIQPKINDTKVDIVAERCHTVKNAFVISNEPFNTDILPNLQNFTTNTSHLIITPKSITTQAQQQNNQSNLIFINEPTFNSAMPLLNLNNTSSNQFPFLMSSSILNETNVSMPFLMNSSPCVPISTSQFPVNFITQPPTVSVPVRRGRPRKIMQPIQKPSTVFTTQTCQINNPILNINKNNTIMTSSIINSNPVASVNSLSNALTIATSSEIKTSNSVINSEVASNSEGKIISKGNKIIVDVLNIEELHPTIVHSKIENDVSLPDPIKLDISTCDESIIIHKTEILSKQSSNIVTTELEIKPTQEELKSTQVASSNEKMHSATPKQNMKPIENLKVKSNSTPRRKSHVRILDFTTPGRSGIVPQAPRTIERSIHLKSANGTKITKLCKFQSEGKVEKSIEYKPQEISTTPKVKKSANKCVPVLSRSASEKNYEKENENTDSNSELRNIGKIGDVNLAANLSPIEEWKQLRNISQTKNWDSYLRFVSAVDTVNKAKIKKSEELARRKMQKLKRMKERKQSKLVVKRLKKPVRKSPRLQKKRKGKIVEKSKKLKLSMKEPKDTKKIETATIPKKTEPATVTKEIEMAAIPKKIETATITVELIAETKREVEQQISDKTTEQEFEEIREVTQKILPNKEKIPPNKEVPVPVIHHPHSMASLLETPFKTDVIHQSNPITPRFLPPLAVEDTPITKILKSLNKHLGSELKGDIFTPNFAITPGNNLTPPKALDIMTPQSGSFSNRPTDYSSGSSYYRPDESDDKIESLVSTSRNKSLVESEYEAIPTQIVQTHQEQQIIVECPGILEKVKSFSENSNPMPEDVVPHYTFNIPDESIENVETEIKDDTSNSSTSSSSSSSSSSSPSSSSSYSSNTSYHPKTKPDCAATKIIDETGEIRYPIRTWITPKKIDKLEPLLERNNPTSVLLSDKQLMLKELEEKRIRMRDKIKISEKSDTKIKKPKQTAGNFKSKKNINSRQGMKQSLISSKPSGTLSAEKPKQPRKNPTPKKLVPLKSNKTEPVAIASNSASYEEGVNELISVLSDDLVKTVKENQKMSDKVSIKSDDIELAEEFKDAYQNATSDEDDDDDDECEIISQSEVLNFIYDEKSSCQTNQNQLNVLKDYLLSSKSVMNVNIDGRKIQIKANDPLSLYEYVPNNLTTTSKSNVGRPKNIENNQKPESRKSDPKYKGNRKEKNDSQGTKSTNSFRNDKKMINRPLHQNTDKKLKCEKTPVVVTTERPEPASTSTNHSIINAKAQFNVKYKIPKTQIAIKPVKKTILSRPFGSTTAHGAVQLDNIDRQELPQSFKIPIKVDMKNKLKPSSSDTINAVLAHLHGTE